MHDEGDDEGGGGGDSLNDQVTPDVLTDLSPGPRQGFDGRPGMDRRPVRTNGLLPPVALREDIPRIPC